MVPFLHNTYMGLRFGVLGLVLQEGSIVEKTNFWLEVTICVIFSIVKTYRLKWLWLEELLTWTVRAIHGLLREILLTEVALKGPTVPIILPHYYGLDLYSCVCFLR